MELNITTRSEGHRTVVDVGGEVDISTASQLRNALNDAVASEACHVVVDLSDTGFMDSTGLGVLIAGLKRARTGAGDLELVCDNENVLQIFRVTGLTRVFTIHPTLDEALSAEGTAAPPN